MEKKNNSLIIIILVVIVLGLGGFIVYDKFLKNNNENTPIKNENIDDANSGNTQNDFNEHDVRQYLELNKKVIEDFFVTFENNYDYNNSNKDDYTNFFAWYLVFGDDKDDDKILDADQTYTYEYGIRKDRVSSILANYITDGEKINSNSLDFKNIEKKYNKGIFNFYEDNEYYRVKVVATGLDPAYSSTLTKVENLDNNQILVTYGLTNYGNVSPNYLKYRVLTLKKIENGYIVLKAESKEV